ncbi:hypothetical protein AXE75_03570 [Gardnerella vaginalis]|uniref:hypothetical protein n=1 Tax=Gardnerella vaginalis TaxID=2702 RepID=UPI000E31962C|nr:hypothetical protein [Gardnerella vaginalis]RFD76395.1 hypothetical protein AXE75_03570 [Gardnerella vaginalis]
MTMSVDLIFKIFKSLKINFRCLVNIIISVYILAESFCIFSKGSSGISNVSTAIKFFGLKDLANKLDLTYESICGSNDIAINIITFGFIAIVVFISAYHLSIIFASSIGNPLPNAMFVFIAGICLFMDFSKDKGNIRNWVLPVLLLLVIFIIGKRVHDSLNTQSVCRRIWNETCNILVIFCVAFISAPLYILIAPISLFCSIRKKNS